MADKNWFSQLSQAIAPIAIVLVGGYGAWDLLIKPWLKEDTQVAACATTITGLYVEIPGKAGQPSKPISARTDLPVVIPSGESRPVTVQLDNPDSKAAVYTWRANYGRFDSRVTSEARSNYIAPPTLINDTLTVEVRLQGCTTATRTATIAVVPSANSVPTTAPTQPSSSTTPPSQTLPTLPNPSPTPSPSPKQQ